MRDSINTLYSTSGLSANILTDASGSRLVLTSTTMGVGSDLTLSGDSGLDVGSSVIEEPKNAKYSIDGIAMESKSNTVTGAVSGVDIKLVSKSPIPTDKTEPTATIIAVSTSNAALKSGVKGFIDSYNALMTAITAETKVTINADGSPTAGALTGDASMRSLVSTIRNEFNAMTGSGALKSLAQFGVSSNQTTGLLVLDDKKWDKAMTTNAADVASIFNGDNGLIKRMTKATDGYATAKTGTLATRAASLSETLTNLTKQQTELDARMATRQQTLSAKYNAMDTLVADRKSVV